MVRHSSSSWSWKMRDHTFSPNTKHGEVGWSYRVSKLTLSDVFYSRFYNLWNNKIPISATNGGSRSNTWTFDRCSHSNYQLLMPLTYRHQQSSGPRTKTGNVVGALNKSQDTHASQGHPHRSYDSRAVSRFQTVSVRCEGQKSWIIILPNDVFFHLALISLCTK